MTPLLRLCFQSLSLARALQTAQGDSYKTLGSKIGVSIKPIFTSEKIGEIIKTREPKPKIINEQCVVYHFKCGLGEMDYVGFTNRHLFQRINEHTNSRSSIGKHMKLQHGVQRPAIAVNFTVLKKCRSKLDCLFFEMLIIKELKPSLNVQSDSVRAKLFTDIFT